MNQKLVRELEERIVGSLVDSALEQGMSISVSLERGYDTDEMLSGCANRQAITVVTPNSERIPCLEFS